MDASILEWLASASVLSILSNVLLFWRQQRMKKATITLDTIKVYQDIAESNDRLLQQQNGRILLLQKKVSHLEVIVIRVKECNHYSTCPVQYLVQDYVRKFIVSDRQPPGTTQGHPLARDNTGEHGDTSSPDGQPP